MVDCNSASWEMTDKEAAEIPWKGHACFAINCAHYANKYWKSRGITFHKFPNRERSPDRFALWVREARRRRKPSRFSSLCSAHFEEKWIDRTGQIVRLRPGAIPQIFTLPPHLQKKATACRSTSTSKKAEEPIIREENKASAGGKAVLEEHSYHGSATKWKKRCEEFDSLMSKTLKQARNAMRREQRAKETCRSLLESLEQQNLINSELQAKLQAYSDIPEAFQQLFRKPEKSYSEEQKDFALTLHLQSAKAYSYLRDQLKVPLPHPRSLKRFESDASSS